MKRIPVDDKAFDARIEKIKKLSGRVYSGTCVWKARDDKGVRERDSNLRLT